jgi:hypothetical protein
MANGIKAVPTTFQSYTRVAVCRALKCRWMLDVRFGIRGVRLSCMPSNVRFVLKATELVRRREMTRRAIRGLMRRSKANLFDHLVGAGEKGRWYGEA